LTGENYTVEPKELPAEDTQTFTVGGTSRYGSQRFYGIVIDTGASKYSTTGLDQFQALQRTDNSVALDESTKGQVTVYFSIGSSTSISSAVIETPIGQVQFHIMLSKTLFLLSLDDIDKLRVYFNNLTNCIVTSTGRHVPIVRRFGYSFLL
jgi:hypothetical protein